MVACAISIFDTFGTVTFFDFGGRIPAKNKPAITANIANSTKIAVIYILVRLFATRERDVLLVTPTFVSSFSCFVGVLSIGSLRLSGLSF